MKSENAFLNIEGLFQRKTRIHEVSLANSSKSLS